MGCSVKKKSCVRKVKAQGKSAASAARICNASLGGSGRKKSSRRRSRKRK